MLELLELTLIFVEIRLQRLIGQKPEGRPQRDHHQDQQDHPLSQGNLIKFINDVVHEFLVPSSPGRRTRSKAVDRKSTRLNSSHVRISYAVFCLKKKNATRAATRR